MGSVLLRHLSGGRVSLLPAFWQTESLSFITEGGDGNVPVQSVVMDVMGLSSLRETGKPHIQHSNKNKDSDAVSWMDVYGSDFSDLASNRNNSSDRVKLRADQ